MKTFIRVTEIWVPTRDRTQLEFGGGLYGKLEALRALSEPLRFRYDEGLAGRAWAARHPVILKDLSAPWFGRSEAARDAGLTCGVAVPLFAGDFLMAVLTFFCGDREQHVGAIELWSNDAGDAHDLGLVDGYFGNAESFEWITRHTKFRPGFGIPGLVWQTGMPQVMENLGSASGFVRRESARAAGIDQGLGIPCTIDPAHTYILTLLSASSTPIARRFEIWVPSERHNGLVFQSGHCDANPMLSGEYAGMRLGRGEGLPGRVWLSGLPAVSDRVADPSTVLGYSAREAGLQSAVAMPVNRDGRLKAVVAWYF